MAVHPARVPRRRIETDGGALAKVVALLLGLLVGTLGIVTVLMWADAGARRGLGRRAFGAGRGSRSRDRPQHRASDLELRRGSSE
jgi:hypothetical protein